MLQVCKYVMVVDFILALNISKVILMK